MTPTIASQLCYHGMGRLYALPTVTRLRLRDTIGRHWRRGNQLGVASLDARPTWRSVPSSMIRVTRDHLAARRLRWASRNRTRRCLRCFRFIEVSMSMPLVYCALGLRGHNNGTRRHKEVYLIQRAVAGLRRREAFGINRFARISRFHAILFLRWRPPVGSHRTASAVAVGAWPTGRQCLTIDGKVRRKPRPNQQ